MLNRLRKGEGSPEAIMRSEVGGKENTTLKPFYNKTENESKEALSEMDQKGRNLLFNGDSIDKKQLKIDQHRFRTEKKERRDHRRLMRTEEKI